MGLYLIPCTQCGKSFAWFSGNTGDQRCIACMIGKVEKEHFAINNSTDQDGVYVNNAWQKPEAEYVLELRQLKSEIEEMKRIHKGSRTLLIDYKNEVEELRQDKDFWRDAYTKMDEAAWEDAQLATKQIEQLEASRQNLMAKVSKARQALKRYADINYHGEPELAQKALEETE